MLQEAATVICLLVAMTSRLTNSSLCSKSEAKKDQIILYTFFSVSNGGGSKHWAAFADGNRRELLRVVVGRSSALKTEEAKLTGPYLLHKRSVS
jgi:hypothetical protein